MTELKKQHPWVEELEKALFDAKPDREYGRLHSPPNSGLFTRVTPERAGRAIKIWRLLVTFLEARGFTMLERERDLGYRPPHLPKEFERGVLVKGVLIHLSLEEPMHGFFREWQPGCEGQRGDTAYRSGRKLVLKAEHYPGTRRWKDSHQGLIEIA